MPVKNGSGGVKKTRRFRDTCDRTWTKQFERARILIISYQYLMLQTGHIHSDSNCINHINLILKELFHDWSSWNNKNVVLQSNLITHNDAAKPRRDNWLKVTKSPWEFAQWQYYEVILRKTKHEYEFYESSIFEDNKVIRATFTQRSTVRFITARYRLKWYARVWHAWWQLCHLRN